MEKELEALEETLRDIAYDLADDDNPILRDRYYGLLDLKQALLKAQENDKVLSIIKEKDVDMYSLRRCKTVEEYNAKFAVDEYQELIKEDFDLLKRYSKK